MATRIGAPWTKEEEETILAQVAKGLRIADIAIAQKRTTGGIRARLTRIACQLVEQKVSVYEASGRTGIRVNRIEEALKQKTEQEAAKKKCLIPKMEFTFTTTTSRDELLGLPMKNKIIQIQNFVEESAVPVVRGQASLEKTSCLWEMDETKLAQHAAQRYRGKLRFTLAELMEGVRARFPGCKVERVEEWVDVQEPYPGCPLQPPTRILKSGIKIDWA